MCGISGKIYFNHNGVSESDIDLMNQKLTHRGPDDSGIYISPEKKVGLGHRRLSIIDLSTSAQQPMNYMDRYWIVFNGEIYNFQEKRAMLQKYGYLFRSKSDTEVILALYDKFGKNCLGHLRGMFSFAIYDEQEKTIFCARDRIGKKPFKYYLANDVFIFSSELKAILTQKEYKREPDFLAIHHYLTLQYCPAPLTGFKDIKKLEPSHYLFIDLKTKKIEKERYWKFDFSQKMDLSEKEWTEKIVEKLEESVQLRMISDVPLGAFLSGGIDSSAIVGIMSKFNTKPIKTFSIGFGEEKYNELPYARIVADKFKTDHTEFILKPDVIDTLPMLVQQYEEPYADSSALPTYYLSKLTRDHVTVALTGDGGDENFSGYRRYSYQKLSLWLEKMSLLNNITARPVLSLFSKLAKNEFFDRASRFSDTLSENYPARYLNYLYSLTDRKKNALYSAEFKERIKNNLTAKIIARKFLEANTENKLEQTIYTDIMTYLPDDLMAKVDMSSMAVSLESRSPLLDHEFMELTAKIPVQLKLKGIGNKKYIFKKALKNLLPEEILQRPKKGFELPIAAWLKRDLKEYTYGKLLSKKFNDRNIFSKEAIRTMLNTHMQTNINLSDQIWTILVLELWFEEYFN